METIPSEMLRGHVDTIILLSLLDCDKHTSQIKEEIESRVDGQFQLKQGTFYSCLQRIVSQGFVTEYRSSSQDGKRRKFYQLTEKGKAYIEDNKDKWLFSRNVIDTLIQVPQDDTPIDSVYSYDKTKQSQAEIINQQANEISELNSKIEQIENQIKENEQKAEALQVIEEKPVDEQIEAKEETQNLTELERFLAGEFEEFKQPEDEVIQQPKENIEVSETKVISIEEAKDKSYEKDLFDIEKEISNQEEIVASSPIFSESKPEITQKIEDNSYNYSQNISNNNQSQIDDYFSGEEPVTHDYKSVLSKLFPELPTQTETPQPTYEPAKELDVSTYFDMTPQAQEEPEIILSEAKKPSHKHIKQLKKSKVLSERPEYDENTKTDDVKYDFSDLQELADSDGFKLRTSTARTNKDIGKIYINKLLASSSITFYLMLLVEIILLGFTTRTVVGLNISAYIIFGACMAVFPIVALILYFIDPKRKVESLITFKSIISFIFIVALNLILIVIVYAILINIDFTDAKELTLFVFYPLIFILNLPIYFFIKYLKLDNQRYYS